MNIMQRTVLMVRPEQREKLAKLAQQEQVSVAEINRRAIDAYESSSKIKQENLELLAEMVLKSNKEAVLAINEAYEEIKKMLLHFQNKQVK